MRRPLIAWVHLAVLWSFAFVKPLFDVLADSPEFFVARGNTTSDILLLAFGVTLIPPSLMLLVELAFWRLDAVRQAVHLAFVGVLAAACAIQLLGGTGVSSALLIPFSLVLGALLALAYVRGRVVATTLTVLAPAPLLFLVLLLVVSPVSKLVFPETEDAVAQAAIPGHTPVVFVVFDEFSVAGLMDADHRIDATRYPNIASLAADSDWYRNATTVADATKLAVPAILTGERADEDALPIAADYPENLFTLLGDSYTFDVDESATDLCPPRLCTATRPSATSRLSDLGSDLSLVSLHLLLPEDLDEDLPQVDRTFSEFRGDAGSRAGARAEFLGGLGDFLRGRERTFASFVARLRPTRGRPRAHFLHVQLPHIPWEYLPGGEQYRVDADMPLPGNGRWTGHPSLTQLGMQRYLLQAGYVDRLVGLLLERLRRTGLYRDSLVVMTADHGLAFKPGLSRRTIDRRTFGEIAGVPLIIKAPGQRAGRVVDAPARSIDILPTVADHLDVRMPWETEGRSLRDGGTGERPLIVDSLDGPSSVTATLAEHVAGLEGAVDKMVRLFGSRDSGRNLFAVGPDRDLLGRAVDGLPRFAGQRAEVEFASAEALRAIDSPSGAAAFVEGRITGDVEAGQRVAVAVDGRIRAVTRTYAARGEVHFWGAVPPGRQEGRGSSQVEVLGIHGQGGDRRLARFRTPSAERLVDSGGQPVIVTAFGERTEVQPDAVNGAVDQVTSLAGNALIVQGWAANTEAGRVADRVVVFADGRLLAAGPPARDRPDVGAEHGRAVTRSGFQLTAGTDAAERIARGGQLRVFALEGDRASELEILGEPKIVD